MKIMATDSSYTISNVNSGLFCDVRDESSFNGANVMLFSQTGGTNQQWIIKPIQRN